MRVLRLAVALEHEPLHHMRDDVALETVVRTLSEGRVRSDRAREIFVGNRVHPVRHMRLKRFAGFDLVARDADFHFSSPSRSEEHTSELQSLMRISYAVFFLKKNTTHILVNHINHSS